MLCDVLSVDRLLDCVGLRVYLLLVVRVVVYGFVVVGAACCIACLM